VKHGGKGNLMSQIGRISGALLKENLVRNGIDLSFETDLLHLDVSDANSANHKIGIKNLNPAYTLDVTGIARVTNLKTGIAEIDNITIDGNTISSTTGNITLSPTNSVNITSTTASTNTTSGAAIIAGGAGIAGNLNVGGNVNILGTVEIDGAITLNDAETITLKDQDNDKYIAIKAPDSVDYSYLIKLPASQPIDYAVLANDGSGNTIWAKTDTFGGNRIYVSGKNGDDANDGVNLPVRTIKRGCQLAASLGQVPTITPSAEFYNAKRLLDDNKEFIQSETIAFFNATYPALVLVYDQVNFRRNVGLIVEAVIYDIILGGNSRSVAIGSSYLPISSLKTETLAAINFARNLAILTIQNQTPTTVYQTVITQTIWPSISGAAAVSVVTNRFNTVTSIIDTGTIPTIVDPAFTTIPITIQVSAGDFYIDNPIIVPDKVSIVGDSLRSVVLRPLNPNNDMFRVRNGVYITGITFRDSLNASSVPNYTFSWAVAFDDPLDTRVDRSGYFGLANTKPLITLSPYIQNCSIISFLGANGCLVDGSKVVTPNRPINNIEAENPVNLADGVPEQGKSMVANAFTMLSFGGTGWLVINDAYAQIVSCFQIFMLNGSYTQSGGYLSITNSATNFGVYALRSSGYSPNSFTFDRGIVAAVGSLGGAITLTTIGTLRQPVSQYVLRLRDPATDDDITSSFKAVSTEVSFNAATAINTSTGIFTITDHELANGIGVYYSAGVNDPISGLINNGLYYVQQLSSNTFKLYSDDSLTFPVTIFEVGSGTHSFIANLEDFFVTDIISSHSAYQELTLTPGTYTFVPGQTLSGLTAGFDSNAFVYSYDPVLYKLTVSNEFTLLSGNQQRILFTTASTITTVAGVTLTTAITITDAATVSGYYTTSFKTASTISNSLLNNPSTALLKKINFHRPSIVNSSAHTWEFAGSGTDYNALPQNGGFGRGSAFEQYSEAPGRVYSSGTNELGDFKVGTFIIAENKTGEITFTSRVTVGEIAILRLSLSDVEINQFSTDVGLGDNEPSGAQDTRISTQKAVRSFVANRLGNVLDKTVSTNSIPGAVVQLNSQGQINPDLLPPARGITTHSVDYWGGRLDLAENIPAIEVLSGDNAIETYTQQVLILNSAVTWNKGDVITQTATTGRGIVKESVVAGTTVTLVNVTGTWNLTDDLIRNGTVATGINPDTINTATIEIDNYFLKSDTTSQYLLLSTGVTYDFTGITVVTGANSGAQGTITTGPYLLTKPTYGIATSLDTESLIGGSGYDPLSGILIYKNVALTGGTGTGATADITVTNGAVSAVELVIGGTGYTIGDTLSATVSGGTNFSIDVLRIDTRLYVDLVGTFIKFSASSAVFEYIQDAAASIITVSNLAASLQKTFVAVDTGGGGNVTYSASTITITSHGLSNGDAVVYNNGGNASIGNLTDGTTYWVNVINSSTIELYTNYSLTSGSKVVFSSSSTGNHTVTRFSVNISSNTITAPAHGLTTGLPIKFVAADAPSGLVNNNSYYVGSVTVNGFTLHSNRADAVSSTNGTTVAAINITSTGTGSATLTVQNVSIIGTVNTSSTNEDNWGAIVTSSSIDASNIVSGIISPSRLAGDSANNKTFLRGDSAWSEAIQNIRPAADSPITFVGDFFTDTGVNYYYNSLSIDISKADELGGNPNFTSIGVASYSKLQFTVDNGQVVVKTGVIDAGLLGGQSGAYYRNPVNLSSAVPISKGGTGLTTYTKGQLLYSGVNDSLTTLSIGAVNTVLVSNADGVPAWSNTLSLGGNLTVAGSTALTANTTSTSKTTGTLLVTGGVGVTGALFANNVTATDTLAHNGLAMTDGTNVDQLKTYTKSLTLTPAWQPTGIKSTDLATGSYYMQIYANDASVEGGHNSVYYSGIISWFAGTPTETTWDEIVLNRAGAAVGTGALFVRLKRTTGVDLLTLEIAGTTTNTGAADYVFKFRRII
jgi:hypothetical protein